MILILIVFLLSGIFLPADRGWSVERGNPEGRQKAMEIAKQQKEVLAFLNLLGGQSSCVNLKVERACESFYVTCVDNADAWVVQYMIDPKCEIRTDGRLGVNFLIDVASGRVISRYPEIDYFNAPDFCRDQPDCLDVPAAGPAPQYCMNFIYAPLKFFSANSGNAVCQCLDHHCHLAQF